MNNWDRLSLHADALATAVEAHPKFFSSILHYVKQLQASASGPKAETSAEELRMLAHRIESFFDQWRPSGDGFYMPPREAADADATVLEINQAVSELAALDQSSFEALRNARLPVQVKRTEAASAAPKEPCVFIGHGRNKIWARVNQFIEHELGVATISFESESRVGESVVPILGKLLAQATFAVLILTAEDETVKGTLRARQNVIHEVGLFQGRLGFNRVVLLLQDGVEGATNLAGLQYIPFFGDSVEQGFYELQRVLKREGHL